MMRTRKGRNPSLNNRKVLIGLLAAIGCEFFYGLSFIFTKQVTGQVSPLTLLGWRFLLACAVLNLLVLLGAVKINLRGKHLAPLLIIALFDPILYYVSETIGVKLTTASESGMIISFVPITTLVCSAIILREKPTRFQLTGIGVATVGVLVIVLFKGVEASLNSLGYLMLFIAVLAYSLYTVYAKKAVVFSNIEKTWLMIVVGALTFGPAALFENRSDLRTLLMLPFNNRDFLYAILFLGIGASILAFFFGNIMITNLGPNRTASFAGLSTVIAMMSGALVLQESLSVWQVIGTILVLLGVYIANRSVENSLRKD